MPDQTKARDARVSIRVTTAGREAIDRKAAEFHLSTSDVARMALAYGLQHMPAPSPRGIKL
jgi:uncharacterized membrane protein